MSRGSPRAAPGRGAPAPGTSVRGTRSFVASALVLFVAGGVLDVREGLGLELGGGLRANAIDGVGSALAVLCATLEMLRLGHGSASSVVLVMRSTLIIAFSVTASIVGACVGPAPGGGSSTTGPAVGGGTSSTSAAGGTGGAAAAGGAGGAGGDDTLFTTTPVELAPGLPRGFPVWLTALRPGETDLLGAVKHNGETQLHRWFQVDGAFEAQVATTALPMVIGPLGVGDFLGGSVGATDVIGIAASSARTVMGQEDGSFGTTDTISLDSPMPMPGEFPAAVGPLADGAQVGVVAYCANDELVLVQVDDEGPNEIAGFESVPCGAVETLDVHHVGDIGIVVAGVVDVGPTLRSVVQLTLTVATQVDEGDIPGSPTGFVATLGGDFDGDFHGDVIVVDATEGVAFAWGDPVGGITAVAGFESIGGATWTSARLVDVDGDTIVDLVVGGSAGLYWRRRLGGRMWDELARLAKPEGTIASFDGADLDGDGFADFVVSTDEGLFMLKSAGTR